MTIFDTLRSWITQNIWVEGRNVNDPRYPLTSEALLPILAGPPSATGKTVNPDTAMRLVAVYACVRLISETFATLPAITYRRLVRGKERAPEHTLYSVLHDIANPEMTSVEFRETAQAHILLWGKSYSEISRNGAGQIKALWPIMPNRVEEGRNRRNEIVYKVRLPDGEERTLAGNRVLKVSGFLGLSPIGQAREGLGLTMAAEEYGGRFFANDSRPGGVLETEKKVSPEVAKRLKASWEAMHSGLSNAHRVAILEEGLKWHQTGIPPEDAQFLETRKFQLNEIARLFRVPPHMIADLERATFSNIEHQSIDFVVHSVRPWLVRWEQSINKTLLTETERATFFVEFLVDGLLRGDLKSRYDAYAVARRNGWLNGDEIREFENLNPIEDGDVYFISSDMQPISRALEEPEPVPVVEAEPEGEADEEENEDDEE